MLRERLRRSFSRRSLFSGLAALALILWSLWMAFAFRVWPAPYWFEHNFTQTVDSPVLAREFARNARDLDAVFQRNDANNPDPLKSAKAASALRLQALLDLVRIPLVCVYFLLFAACYSLKGRWHQLLVAIVTLFGLCAICESVLIVFGTALIFVLAIVKWVLDALMLLVLGMVLASRREGPYSVATRRLFAWVHFASGALLLTGIVFDRLPWLALGSRIVALSVILNCFGLLGPVFAIQGVTQKPEPDFCIEHR